MVSPSGVVRTLKVYGLRSFTVLGVLASVSIVICSAISGIITAKVGIKQCNKCFRDSAHNLYYLLISSNT